jgi:DNA-binding NarL/FixJ family response regulator
LVSLVPLLPGEAKDVLRGEPVHPELEREDEEIARLAAQGLTIGAIAHTVGMSSRGVEYRLAALRQRFGAASTAELRLLLARRGL